MLPCVLFLASEQPGKTAPVRSEGNPVRIEALAGMQTGLAAMQAKNRVAWEARKSRCGVLTRRPAKPKQSTLC
jgi:hypothetical protein